MAGPSHARPYRGTPASERAGARRKQLIAAAGELAAEGGRMAVTVRAVCHVAGLNQRYFYESFETVDELLAASFDAFVLRAMSALTAPIDAKKVSLREGTRLIVERLLPLFEAAGPGSQDAICVALGSDAFTQRRTALLDEAVEIVAAGIERLPGRGDLGPQITRIATRILVVGVTEALVAWGTGRLIATREQMLEHCTTVAIATINTTGTGQPV